MTDFRTKLYSERLAYKMVRGLFVFVLIFSWVFSNVAFVTYDDISKIFGLEHSIPEVHAATLSGTMTEDSAFNDLEIDGTTATFNANASTSDFIITSGTTTAPSDLLSIEGDYTNNGIFIHNYGTTTFDGSGADAQVISGTLISTEDENNNSFYDVVISNTTATTTFNAAASTTNNLWVKTPGVRVEFAGGATSTVANLIIAGSSGNEIYLHATGTPPWNIHATGTVSVDFANIKDSDACSEVGNLTASNSVDGGSNSCWTISGVVAATLNQRAYVFRNDDGAGGGGLASTTIQEATSTPRTSVLQGERIIVAFQLDNTGTATSSIPYQLQFEKDGVSDWNGVGTTTAIRYSSSLTGAKTSRNNFWQPIGTSTGAIVNNECDPAAGGNFIGGRLVTGQSSTTPMDIGANDCAELAFAIHTGSSTLGQVYNFRLVHATTSATLDAYTINPKITIEAARNIRFSKGAIGGVATSTLDWKDNTGQFTSIAIGTDGFPVIAYYNVTNTDLEFAKCNDVACTSIATSTLDDRSGEGGGYHRPIRFNRHRNRRLSGDFVL